MTKFLIRFFLSLCILLPIAGYELYGLGFQDYTPHASLHFLDHLKPAGLAGTPGSAVLRNESNPSDGEKRLGEAAAAETREEEEKKLIATAQQQKGSPYLGALLYVHTLGYFLRFTRQNLPSGKPFSHGSSFRRHLLLRVLRI